MSDALRHLKTGSFADSAAILAGISFVYGVLHAVGPGHGKFVVSSYALANDRTIRRGVLLSFMAAFIQALSAIAIVGLLSIVLRSTGLQMRLTEARLETASWGLIALFGAWLLFGQLRRLWATWRTADATDTHARHDHGAHDHAHGAHDHHDQGHIHDESCGHAHVATPEQLGGQWSWPKAWSLALSIGIRPCTGAIGVLIFAFNIGLFWAGILATFAMAVGTALTVSSLAILAVASRKFAERLAGTESRWAANIQSAAGVVGSALIIIMGATFFVASLHGGAPL
jgi:ABC-type nickel/cobalt efflux system permease component RcnA